MGLPTDALEPKMEIATEGAFLVRLQNDEAKTRQLGLPWVPDGWWRLVTGRTPSRLVLDCNYRAVLKS